MQYRTVQYGSCFVFSGCMLLQLLFADLRLPRFPLTREPVSRRTRALALLNRVTLTYLTVPCYSTDLLLLHLTDIIVVSVDKDIFFC